MGLKSGRLCWVSAQVLTGSSRGTARTCPFWRLWTGAGNLFPCSSRLSAGYSSIWLQDQRLVSLLAAGGHSHLLEVPLAVNLSTNEGRLPLLCLFFCCISLADSLAFCLCYFFFFFSFLGPHPRHMEVPRLWVQLELQLPAYVTATAMPDPSRNTTAHSNTISLTH